MADRIDANRAGGNASGARAAVAQRSALDPRVPVLVQPFKRLVEEGFITELTVTFTPMGTECKGKADSRLAAVEGSGLDTTTHYPVGRLAAAAEKGQLALPPKRGKKGAKSGPAENLPTKSLCKKDFENTTPEKLQARINEIAASAGGGPLVGRVRSANMFTGTQTTSYGDWWASANGAARAASLAQKRHFDTFSDEEKNALRRLQCPFRGTAEFAVSAEAADDEDQ